MGRENARRSPHELKEATFPIILMSFAAIISEANRADHNGGILTIASRNQLASDIRPLVAAEVYFVNDD